MNEKLEIYSQSKFMNSKILFAFALSLSFFLTEAQQTPTAKVLRTGFIYDTAPFPSCHASTIAKTPSGLIAAWFGGTHEKHEDVEIWISREQHGKWTAPVSVATGVQNANKRFPCWNPVLFQYPGGPLMLFYKVGPDPQSWWGEMKTSTDEGKTWTQAIRLPEGILGPVKNKPVLMSDGRLICPSSTENKTDGRWQAHLEVTTDMGKSWTSTGPLNDGKEFHLIQPSLLFYPGKQQLLCRSQENRIVSLWSTDDARTWSKPEKTDLLNPNSGTDAVTLSNGWQLLVYNPTTKTKNSWGGTRSPLNVAMSKDGYSWKDVLVLENTPGEFSYPAVIESKDGTVHITYTWNRKKIKYVSLRVEGGGNKK